MDTSPVHDTHGPFEGAEKLLELWFAPSPAHLPDAHRARDCKIGLRKVPRAVWEDMLAIVRCKILSVVEGAGMDAYLLRSVVCPPFTTASAALGPHTTCSCLPNGSSLVL